MKIKKVRIKNVTSYRDLTEFSLDDGINILIGPNGGGKSNLQRIIALTLSKFFIRQYQFRHDNNSTGVEIADPWTQRQISESFPKFRGDDSDQLIEIELMPEQSDINNIKTIGENLDSFNRELNYWEKQYEFYSPFPLVEKLSLAETITFTVRNLMVVEPPPETAAWAFREYLREYFIFLRMANRIPNISLTSPVFFFSSERAIVKSFDIQAGQLTEQSYFDGVSNMYQAATGNAVNLMQWGAQHFVRLYRRAVSQSSRTDQTWDKYFDLYPDVAYLTKYLSQLGYEWELRSDVDQLTHLFYLEKNGEAYTTNMFSSGEREIVHFLLAMFALNVKDGLILVDEPELHLHPRWQHIFLRLFNELSAERNNQFLITTHSASFVTPETIDTVTRVYKGNRGSSQVALKNVELPDKKKLVRMINAQNNEGLFFADKVVLVEGITDRLLFESLIECLCLRFNVASSIEVLEVGGKHNVADYKQVLAGLHTPCFVVADLDYLSIVGSNDVRGLFSADYRKEWNALTKDKKSTDRASMISHLGNAIVTGTLDELRKFWDYFKSRRSALRSVRNDEENACINRDIYTQAIGNVFVLKKGEIEDYLPPGDRDVPSIVELITDRNWINKIQPDEYRIELGWIAIQIVGIEEEQRNLLLTELSNGTVNFSSP